MRITEKMVSINRARDQDHGFPTRLGGRWLHFWVGLTVTSPVLFALWLLAGLSSGTKAQTTSPTISPTEIYEGETLEFTMTLSGTQGMAWDAMDDNIQGASGTVAAQQTSSGGTGDWYFADADGTWSDDRIDGTELSPVQNDDGTYSLGFHVHATADSDTSEGDESLTIVLRLDSTEAGNVTFTLKEGPRPGVTITPTSLALEELGTSSTIEKTYAVVLDTDPTANVTITVINGDNSAVEVDTDSGNPGNQDTITFTAGGDGSGSGIGNGNWAVPQTVTVRALNDADTDPESFNITHTATTTGNTGPYHSIAINPVAVTTTDAGRGVLVSEISLWVAGKNEEETYTVVLESQPNGGNVEISAKSRAPEIATVSPATLTFTPGNWNRPQTVTVTGQERGDTNISHEITSSKDMTNYPITTGIRLVSVIVMRPNNLDISVRDAHEGEDIVLTLTLDHPLDSIDEQQRKFQFNVRQLSSNNVNSCINSGICTSGVEPATSPADFTATSIGTNPEVTFGPTETTKTLRIATAMDNNDESVEVVGIVILYNAIPFSGPYENQVLPRSFSSTSGRDQFISPPEFTFPRATINTFAYISDSATDDVIITPTYLALTELGTLSTIEKTYTVVLDTDPRADVTITVTNGDNSAVEVDTDSGNPGNQDTLTFTAGGDGSGTGTGNGNWAMVRTVTVTALNDVDAANESFSITHTATTTGNTGPYHNIAINPVAVTTRDAGHGVVVSESSLSVKDLDDKATYTVVLKGQPSGNVEISPTSDATFIAEVDTDARHGGQPGHADVHQCQLERTPDGDGDPQGPGNHLHQPCGLLLLRHHQLSPLDDDFPGGGHGRQ